MSIYRVKGKCLNRLPSAIPLYVPIQCISIYNSIAFTYHNSLNVYLGENKPVLMVIEDDRIMEQAPTFTWTEPANRSVSCVQFA